MRKWMVFGGIVVVLTWGLTLVWMRANGAYGNRAYAEETGTAGKTKITENMGRMAVEDDIAVTGAENVGNQEAAAADTAGPRRILLERNGIQTYLAMEDYLPGVIACQVDPQCHMEVLKCQAVIARTYIERLMDGRSEIHEEELDLDYLEQHSDGYDESGGLMTGTQGRLAAGNAERLAAGNKERLAAGNKERLAAGLERCRQAVEDTCGMVMEYDGRCILPLFHAMNNGRTRTGDSEYPYLKSVESIRDGEREDCTAVFHFDKNDFAGRISRIADTEPIPEDQLTGQIQTVWKDDAGYVQQMKIGSKTYSGEEVQYALELPSACFVLSDAGDGIDASVKGRGHGYGLSQAGAEAMAEEGWGWEEILLHYYTGITLVTR